MGVADDWTDSVDSGHLEVQMPPESRIEWQRAILKGWNTATSSV